MSEETEQYVELYKKYRPNSWGSLIGQQKVAQSLQNAILKNKVPTVYGFFGPRGTGKTSSALLLAKSINCLQPLKNANPCNVCEVCTNIDSGSQMGVNYISMANNGSIDDVRELVKKARNNQPVKRQVWILDEAHRISKTAFDSLLIPFEDKSMPAVFIVCSTEVEQIPGTILSRIQSRTFNLVTKNEMLEFLKTISEKESLNVDEKVLNAAVRLGRGSVRDTLTSLESILDTGDLGVTYGGELLEELTAKNLPGILKVISEGNSDGVNFRDLTEQLFEDLRNLLLLNAGVNDDMIGIIPIDNPQQTIAAVLGERGLNILLEEIGQALTRMSLGADYRIHLEIAMIESFSKLKRLKRLLDQRKNSN